MGVANEGSQHDFDDGDLVALIFILRSSEGVFRQARGCRVHGTQLLVNKRATASLVRGARQCGDALLKLRGSEGHQGTWSGKLGQ